MATTLTLVSSFGSEQTRTVTMVEHSTASSFSTTPKWKDITSNKNNTISCDDTTVTAEDVPTPPPHFGDAEEKCPESGEHHDTNSDAIPASGSGNEWNFETPDIIDSTSNSASITNAHNPIHHLDLSEVGEKQEYDHNTKNNFSQISEDYGDSSSSCLEEKKVPCSPYTTTLNTTNPQTTTTHFYHFPRQEEPFQFDLDSRSPSLASLKISRSPLYTDGSQSFVNTTKTNESEIEVNSKATTDDNDDDDNNDDDNKNNENTAGGIGAAITTFREIPPNVILSRHGNHSSIDDTTTASSPCHHHHHFPSVQSMSTTTTNQYLHHQTPPSSLIHPEISGYANVNNHTNPKMPSNPNNNNNNNNTTSNNATDPNPKSIIQTVLQPVQSIAAPITATTSTNSNNNITTPIPSEVQQTQTQTQTHTQQKREKKKRVIRPFVYSAIGSLEHINQHSFGSFNHKVIAASKSKKKTNRDKANGTGTKQSVQNVVKKKKKHPVEETEKKEEEEKRNVMTYSATETSLEKMDSAFSMKEPRALYKSTNDLLSKDTTTNDLEEEEEPRRSLKLSVQNASKETISSNRRNQDDTQRREPSLKKGRRKNQKKKNVTIDGKPKKITQVELFRPSCDAYTPRMGKKKIKYKPAEERASMEKMSTTMGTIHRPNFRDALRRVAIIIQQHIVKIERRFEVGVPGLDNAGLFIPAMRDAFAEDNFVTPRYKCSMVKLPMARPGLVYGMRKIRTVYEIPSANDIYEFAHQLFNSVQLSSECSIICLIYVERLMENAKVPVMANTWRPIVMCGLLLASKVWQDWSSWNIEFASVYPQFSLDSINRLELQFLKMVKWDLYISSSLYAKYYFALRSLLEKQDFRRRYNSLVGGVDSRAALEAVKISKRSELLKEEALSHLSTSM